MDEEEPLPLLWPVPGVLSRVFPIDVVKFLKPLLFSLLHAALLALLLSTWWVHRNHHLFGNSNWIVGKDQGKFVFYTYEWMFRPIQYGIIDLAQDQGFQELLYHQPEDAHTRLEKLECDVEMSQGTYIWFQFQKTQEARRGYVSPEPHGIPPDSSSLTPMDI